MTQVSAISPRGQVSGIEAEGDPLVVVRGLVKYFPLVHGLLSKTAGHVRAVDGLDFAIHRRETLGLVGESGCGKTTTGRLILNLLPPTAGEVWYEGQNVFRLRGHQLRQLRRQMQIVFQDPYASLNPRLPVGEIIAEPLIVHGVARGREKEKRVKELLEVVGLPWHCMYRYPHEFSGGQRQRIGIARALALHPRLIVCDEAVSALDVSIQSQVLNLLHDLQDAYGLTYLFITHNLAVVRHISDRVGVMYLGKLVELAETQSLFDDPLHPYTKALLSAVPRPEPGRRRSRIVLKGDVPSPVDPPAGCRFHPRCWEAEDICRQVEPSFRPVEAGRLVACHLAGRETSH